MCLSFDTAPFRSQVLSGYSFDIVQIPVSCGETTVSYRLKLQFHMA